MSSYQAQLTSATTQYQEEEIKNTNNQMTKASKIRKEHSTQVYRAS
jgi:hypothetical protein